MAVPRFPTVFARHYLAGSGPSTKTRHAVWRGWKACSVRGGGSQSRAVNILATSGATNVLQLSYPVRYNGERNRIQGEATVEGTIESDREHKVLPN